MLALGFWKQIQTSANVSHLKEQKEVEQTLLISDKVCSLSRAPKLFENCSDYLEVYHK